MAEFSDQDDLPELSACYQQHIQQIVDVLDESEVSDSEAQSDREKDESSDSTENSEDWEQSSATVSRVSRLMCSQPVNVMQQCDQVAAGTTEDLEVAPLLDFSDSESESVVFYQDTSPHDHSPLLDTSPHSPLLGYASEENEHQDLEEQATSDIDDEVQEEDSAKTEESSQEEEEESSAEEEEEEEEEEEGQADSTSGATASSVDPKHNLRASNTERKDGPQDTRKRRKEPIRFSSYQLEQLERVYKLDPYPDSSKKAAVAVKLNINLGSVRNWFSNRRTRRQSAKPRLKRKERSSEDGRGGKKRERFSPVQLGELEKNFQQFGPYVDPSVQAQLAKRLNVKPARVRVWFQNRRNKWKREGKPRMNKNSIRGRRMVPKPEAVDSPRTSSTDRKKRTKGWFSPDQVEELEKSFQQFGPYPEASVQAQLAKKLNTKPAKVYNWMNRRRFKWRKCGEPRLNGTSRKRSCPNPPDTPSKTTKSSQDDSTRLTRKRKKEEEEAVKGGRGRKLTRELRSLLPSVGSPKQEQDPQTVENLLQDMLTKTKPRQLKPAQACKDCTPEAASSSNKGKLGKGRSRNSQKRQDSSPEVEETERTGKRGKQKRQRRKIDNSCFQEPPDTPSDTLPDLGHQKPPNTSSDTRKPGRARKVSEKSRSAAQTQEAAATSGTHDVFPRPEGVNSDDKDLMSKRSCCNLFFQDEIFLIKKEDINKPSPPIYKYVESTPERYDPYKWEEEKWYYIRSNTYSSMAKGGDPRYLQIKVTRLPKETVGEKLIQRVKWMPGEVTAMPLPRRNGPPSARADNTRQPNSSAVSTNNSGQPSSRHRSSSEASATSQNKPDNNNKASIEGPSRREAARKDHEAAVTNSEVESSASFAGTPSTSGDPGAGQSNTASPPTVTSTSTACFGGSGARESPCRQWGVSRQIFLVYLQTLISYALDPSFLDEVEEDGDMYFLMAIEAVETKVREGKDRVMQNVTFDPEFKAAVEKYPYINTWTNNTLGNQTCQACLSDRTATQTLNLRGRAYSRSTLREWPGEKGSKVSSVCQFCADHTQTFHQLHHYKYRLFRKCENKVTAVRRSHEMSSDDETCKRVLLDRGWVSELHEELEELLSRAQQSSNC